MLWDLFISHASEDKDLVARPLAQLLTAKGLRVWYDEMSLVLGDSLRRKIDDGLANSRFGVVILSPDFLRKEWTQRELDGLTAREIAAGKVILPVWHKLDREQLSAYSPTLVDRLGVSTSKGLDYVVDEILKALGTVPAEGPIEERVEGGALRQGSNGSSEAHDEWAIRFEFGRRLDLTFAEIKNALMHARLVTRLDYQRTSYLPMVLSQFQGQDGETLLFSVSSRPFSNVSISEDLRAASDGSLTFRHHEITSEANVAFFRVEQAMDKFIQLLLLFVRFSRSVDLPGLSQPCSVTVAIPTAAGAHPFFESLHISPGMADPTYRGAQALQAVESLPLGVDFGEAEVVQTTFRIFNRLLNRFQYAVHLHHGQSRTDFLKLELQDVQSFVRTGLDQLVGNPFL